MPVVTRFAPSPTGFLHIGGGRTALFNWLYARHHGGQFLLRIEDTDRQRSTEAAIEAIFEGLRWLGLDWDGEPVFQSRRAERHAAIARQLLADGHAYRCYVSPAELEAARQAARAAGGPWRFESPWRDADPASAPAGIAPVIRFKAPREGQTVIADQVQGEVTFANEQLDDLIILRADGTPTYNLSVVVDDHDMGITHVIRGDDHLTNAARQTQLYLACGWAVPTFAHVPLIHGPDGAKLSKRHGALGVEAYRDMGYLPAAMRNYLLRLGWSHGDDEIIATEQAIEWFGLETVGRSPSRFDFAKLEHLNGHYIRQTTDAELVTRSLPFLAKLAGRPLHTVEQERLAAAMPSLKQRVKTLVELAETASFIVAQRPLQPEPAARRLLDGEAPALLRRLAAVLAAVEPFDARHTEAAVRSLAERDGVKLGTLAQPLRAALTGRAVSPPVFDVLAVLGREESLARLQDAATS